MKKVIKFIFSPEIRIPLLIILIGLTIRIILLPLATHGDSWCAIRSQYYWFQYGLFKINQLPEVFQGVYLKLIDAPILRSALPTLFENYHGTEGLGGDVTIALSRHPMAMRVLFFYKLPYLIFDLGCVAVLFKIFKGKSARTLVAVSWAFNPLVLHSVYMWGRYEIFSIFFILCAFYYVKKNNAIWSILMYGLAVAFRMPYMLVLPLFIIYFSKNWKDGLKYTLLGLLPFLISNKLLSVLGPNTSDYYTSIGFFSYFLSSQISGAYAGIALNFFAYASIVWLFLIEKRNVLDFKKLVYFSLMIFLTTFSFSYFHPQYAAWLTSFLIIAMALNRKIIIPAIISLILLYLVINGAMGETTGLGLFLPSSEILYQMPKINILPFKDDLSNTLIYNSFILMNLIIMYMLYKDKNSDRSEI